MSCASSEAVGSVVAPPTCLRRATWTALDQARLSRPSHRHSKRLPSIHFVSASGPAKVLLSGSLTLGMTRVHSVLVGSISCLPQTVSQSCAHARCADSGPRACVAWRQRHRHPRQNTALASSSCISELSCSWEPGVEASRGNIKDPVDVLDTRVLWIVGS